MRPLEARCRPWTQRCNDATALAGYATMMMMYMYTASSVSHKPTSSQNFLASLKLLTSHVMSLLSYIFLNGSKLSMNPSITSSSMSFVYKVLKIIQPSYLLNLISVQPPRSSRSSSLVTLARPPTSSMVTSQKSLLSMCITLSVESTVRLIPSTSTQSLYFWPKSCACPLTTLTTRHSLTRDLKPVSQVLPSSRGTGLAD